MLRTIAPDLYIADHEARLGPGFWLPIRMTVLRDGSDLTLISPLPMTDELAAAIVELGTVRFVVGPSCYHHLHLRQAHERFPDAQLIAAPGLAQKRSNLPFAIDLRSDPSPFGSGGAIELYSMGGMPKLGETVALHRPSGTLVVADLVFNMRSWRGALTGLTLGIMGTRGKLAKSRLINMATKDKPALRQSVEHIVAWPFDRLICAHGEVVESGARAQLAAIFDVPLPDPV